MNKQERITVTYHAARWSMNMLVEVLSNHGNQLTDEKRQALKAAVMALGDMLGPPKEKK